MFINHIYIFITCICISSFVSKICAQFDQLSACGWIICSLGRMMMMVSPQGIIVMM